MSRWTESPHAMPDPTLCHWPPTSPQPSSEPESLLSLLPLIWNEVQLKPNLSNVASTASSGHSGCSMKDLAAEQSLGVDGRKTQPSLPLSSDTPKPTLFLGMKSALNASAFHYVAGVEMVSVTGKETGVHGGRASTQVVSSLLLKRSRRACPPLGRRWTRWVESGMDPLPPSRISGLGWPGTQ